MKSFFKAVLGSFLFKWFEFEAERQILNNPMIKSQLDSIDKTREDIIEYNRFMIRKNRFLINPNNITPMMRSFAIEAYVRENKNVPNVIWDAYKRDGAKVPEQYVSLIPSKYSMLNK